MARGTETAFDARIERETKLVPGPEFELSDLAALVPGTTARHLPPLDLEAIYFDTHDLALIRAGITIRHRTGDGAPTWTLKLPTGERSGGLVRRELDIEGPRGRRPRQLAVAVGAHLRGRRLIPVAEIHTVRNRVVIEDDEGHELVEVAHDLVTAVRGRHLLGSWEEIEVESRGEDQGAAAQAAVVRSLRKAGCAKAPAVPKVVRGLGVAAGAPPEVTVPALPRRPTVAALTRRALARSVVQVLAHDPAVRVGDDPEDLHQLRVGIRRLRSDLRTFRDFLDAGTTVHLRSELRWIADLTNELRDLDVLRAWLRAEEIVLPAEDRTAVDVLVRRADDQADRHRRDLLRAMGSPRYGTLIHELVELVTAPAAGVEGSERRACKHLERQVQRRWDALVAELAALEAEPGDAQLHRARIAAKRCRAAVEAVEPLHRGDEPRLARSLAALQDDLGAAHDAAVIETWLRKAADSSAAFVAGELAVVAQIEGRTHVDRWPAAWAKARRRRSAR